MATEINVTREETVERRWDCPRCQAHGIVVMRAHGESGWRRIGFLQSRDDVADDAEEKARWDVQHDAERIMAMIRCPSCHQRAPRVVFWSAMRTIWPLLTTLVTAAVLFALVYFAWGWPWWVGPLFAAVAIGFGVANEVRRWRTAGRTHVQGLRAGPSTLPVAVARPKSPPPAPPSIEPLASAAPTIAKPTDPGDGPQFLK